jgi:hypothetical protein
VNRFRFIVLSAWILCAAGIEPAGASTSPPGPVEVTAAVRPARIYTDQTATLEIAVTYPGDGRDGIVAPPELPALPGLAVGNRSTSTETVREPSGIVTRVRYVFSLVPEGPGTVSIDSVRVAWSDSLRATGGSRMVGAGTLRIVKRPPVIGAAVHHPFRFAAGAGLLVAGAAVLVWLWRRRRSAALAEPEGTPAEILERDCRTLRMLARRGALGPFSEESSRAVRRFVERLYGIPGARLPTPAIVENLKAQDAPSGMVTAVQRVLAFVDDMKFGLWVPTGQELETVLGEIEQIWVSGRDLAGPASAARS